MENYSEVYWGKKEPGKIFQYWKVPEGKLEAFLQILVFNEIDLNEIKVRFVDVSRKS